VIELAGEANGHKPHYVVAKIAEALDVAHPWL
jgi:UDP-N-acetyl-D-mannosaminuronate dehydrogenase